MASSCMFNGRGSQQHGHSRSRDLYLPTGSCSPPVDSSTDDFVQRSIDGAFVRGVIKGTDSENSSTQSKWPTARHNLLAALPNMYVYNNYLKFDFRPLLTNRRIVIVFRLLQYYVIRLFFSSATRWRKMFVDSDEKRTVTV
jgi:hypothetical protein